MKSKDIPKIKPILAIFEPIILPKTKPPAPELIAEIEVKSSGDEVATETMVSPTMTGGTPSFPAKVEQLSERKSPPFTNKNSPKILEPTSRAKNPRNEISLKIRPQMLNSSYTNSVKFAIIAPYQLQGQSKVRNPSLT